MKKQAIYREFARYYDLMYSYKDYKGEVDKIKGLIKKYKESSGNTLLEVGCGTGKHIQYFKDGFSILGIDISSSMLEIARKNNKNIVFKQADMTKLNLRKQFDVILCLFSSIAYVKTISNLEKTLRNFATHLKKGGIVIIEPWFTKSTYTAGLPYLKTYDGIMSKSLKFLFPNLKGIFQL